MRQLLGDADLDEGLAHLTRADPRLVPVLRDAGSVGLYSRPPGFEGLARIVVAQMLSVASADAIWKRLADLSGEVTAERFLALDEAGLRLAGLSGAKIRTLTAVAEAVENGLDLIGLAEAAPEETATSLMALPGIGRWTAEIYLLFCARQADIFPAGDLALRQAVMEGLGLERRPDETALRAIAASWSPWRGVAATLFWAYYKAMRGGRTALPV